MNYTKGEWKVVSDHCNNDSPYKQYGSLSITANNKNGLWFVCEVMGNTGIEEESCPTEQSKANAKLIAAAPDLLEALLAVKRHGLIEQDGYETVVGMVSEAIKKATT